MRKLNTGDVFKVLQIFRVAGLKNEFAEVLNHAFTGKPREEVGGKLFAMLFDCLGNEKTEPLLVKLLANIAHKTPEDILGQPINETVDLLREIVKNNDMKSFFGDAAALT